MLRNYLKIAFRNLAKNKTYSFINIGGLAIGMAVAMLIGLWIFDELSFNKYHKNYDRIVQVMQNQTFNDVKGSQMAVPYLLGEEIRQKYSSDFKHITMASWTNNHILASGSKKLNASGNFLEPEATEMLTLKMLRGNRDGLKEINSIMLSETVAKNYFGNQDPLNKIIKLDNKFDLRVTGVYEDFPQNSDFWQMKFISTWQLYINNENWSEKATNPWRANMFLAYAQVSDHADIEQVSAKIKDVKLNKVRAEDAAFKPEIFLHPMSKWHLYSDFKDGKVSGGRIDFVWLFGTIGVLVLLLACINFMNLSTARSEKRAKEVGVRKAIGSLRGQLILQFFSESLMVSLIAFLLSIFLVQVSLPFFNEMADKHMALPWHNPLLYLAGLGFSLFTGFVSGSYPALYLSSFQPVKILKGSFRIGRFAAIPRKVLVVLQFTVSVALIIGTFVVFRQVQFAKNRPIGYERSSLITVSMNTAALYGHYNAIRNDLLQTGAVAEMSQSSNPPTYIAAVNNGYEWEGKSPGTQGNFAAMSVSHDFGKTLDWKIKEGRDFSRSFSDDTSAVILNETAVKFMGLKNPVDATIKIDGQPHKVVGVVKDIVMDSPYTPVFRTVFMLDYDWANNFNIKINPEISAKAALGKIEVVFKKYNPEAPFDYRFVDEQYAAKFAAEERIGKLITFFACLAVFISCLGLFGLASFVAEQRTKEIGIRKVLGASVFNLWKLLSGEFVGLVVLSCLIAAPLAWYFLDAWLLKYDYRTQISWWIFVISGVGALVITLLTVSFQSIKAALMDPVRSLRSE